MEVLYHEARSYPTTLAAIATALQNKREDGSKKGTPTHFQSIVLLLRYKVVEGWPDRELIDGLAMLPLLLKQRTAAKLAEDTLMVNTSKYMLWIAIRAKRIQKCVMMYSIGYEWNAQNGM